MTEIQDRQDEGLAIAARARLQDDGLVLTRYSAVVECVRSNGKRVLWRLSGPEDIADWDVDGLLYAGLHGEFGEPEDDDE